MPTKRDPARSYERIDDDDLERLGRVADAGLDSFFARNPHLRDARDRVALVALAQGAAEHRLRGERGIWDLDLIVCFVKKLTPLHPQRRQVVSWDWGPSKFGCCPFDPPEYTGRAVDVKYWTIPDATDPVDGLQEWLRQRAIKPPRSESHARSRPRADDPDPAALRRRRMGSGRRAGCRCRSRLGTGGPTVSLHRDPPVSATSTPGREPGSLRVVLFYGLVDRGLGEAIELFVERAAAERMLAECLEDEPGWEGVLAVEKIDLGPWSPN